MYALQYVPLPGTAMTESLTHMMALKLSNMKNPEIYVGVCAKHYQNRLRSTLGQGI